MTRTPHFFLAIEGPIGVGKTTLARLLQPRLKVKLLLEAFEENPFLSDFYGDRARYAFQTQIFFLLSRYRQQHAIPKTLTQDPLIADYTFAKDSLFAHLNLTGDELDIYEQLYRVLSDRVHLPDLVVYLRADTDELMIRIATRDRAYEREMNRAYIENVRQAYARYFAEYTRTPLLIVDTNDLDYVQDPDALALVEGRVREALGIGTYQQPLPQMEAIGPAAQMPDAPRNELEGSPNWRGLEEFLTANEAMGRVGAALAGRATESPEKRRAELEKALHHAEAQLLQLAHAVNVDLQKGIHQ